MIKSFLAFSLVALSTVTGVNSAHALSWNFSGTSPTSSVNSVLYTDGSSYATNTIYNITSASGTVNGNSITGLASAPAGFTFDNKFVWDGSSGILLSGLGLGFLTASSSYNPYSMNGGTNGSLLSSFSSNGLLSYFPGVGGDGFTSISLTPVPLVWNFSATSPTSSINATIYSNNGGTYAANTIYNITAVSGTINGNPIIGLASAPAGFTFDNKFVWDGSSGILLSGLGLGFLTASSSYNPYSTQGGTNGSSLSSFSSNGLLSYFPSTLNGDGFTSISFTPVPFEFSPTLGLGVLGSLFLAKKLSSKILKKAD